MTNFLDNFYIKYILYIFILSTISTIIVNKNSKKNIKAFSKSMFKIDFNLLLRIFFISLFFRIIIEQIFYMFPNLLTTQEEFDNMLKLITVFITTCFFAPVLEEIIFRFGLFNYIKSKTNFILSLIITSLIFSYIHLYNVDGFIVLLFISIIWTYIYNKTDNLIYPIILHFLHNIYAFITNISISTNIYILICILCLLIYVFLKIKHQQKVDAKKLSKTSR